MLYTIHTNITYHDPLRLVFTGGRPAQTLIISIPDDCLPVEDLLNTCAKDSRCLSTHTLILLDFINSRMSIQSPHMILRERRRNRLYKFMFMRNLTYQSDSSYYHIILTSFISDTLLDSTINLG